MTDRPLPFALDGRGLVERAVLADGAVFSAAPGGPSYDPRTPPLLTVAWREGDRLDEVVEPGTLLADRETTTIAGVDAVRTFALHLTPGGLATASEQWRLVAAGRCWVVSAMTALDDQPEWGPRLAAVAASFRPA